MDNTTWNTNNKAALDSKNLRLIQEITSIGMQGPRWI